MTTEFEREIRIEKFLRRHKWIIPAVTFIAAGLLYTGIYWCMAGFRQHHFWTIIPAGILAHAFLIITVHEGAHKAITRRRFDYFIMNLGAAAILLPFYGEPFRKYHLTHHANTNTEFDPLWPPFKRKMFETKRWLYILCECIPILFTFILVTSGKKEQKVTGNTVKQPPVRIPYLLFAFSISLLIIFYAQPPLLFVFGSIFFLNLTSAFRHWCEHMGTDTNKESNTFWFPLGMGIGNHEAHHRYPHFSWVTMMTGLSFRKKDTGPFKTFRALISNKAHRHYH